MTENETLPRLLESSNATILSLQETIAKQNEASRKQQEDFRKQEASLLRRIDSLTAQLANLQRMLFGKKSEKLPAYDPNWPGLFDGQLPEGYAETMQAGEEAAKEIGLKSATSTYCRYSMCIMLHKAPTLAGEPPKQLRIHIHPPYPTMRLEAIRRSKHKKWTSTGISQEQPLIGSVLRVNVEDVLP